MQRDADSPYDYKFERGLYCHHILEYKLLCGSQPICVDDIRYLKDLVQHSSIYEQAKCPRIAHFRLEHQSFRAAGALSEIFLLIFQRELVSPEMHRLRQSMAAILFRCCVEFSAPACLRRLYLLDTPELTV